MKKSVNAAQHQNNKSKGKQKAKHKPNKFNPLEYLNSLIDQIHDPRFQTVRKKSNSLTRSQRTSALAYVTPITQRTFSPSKPRSKSSFSQHRKKSTMRDILKIQLQNVITQEDNIFNFTEQTVQNEMQDSKLIHVHRSKLSHVVAAKRIQRAWRRYKTLKMLKKYQIIEGALWQNRCRQNQPEIYIKKAQNNNAKDFDRTLKIKRNHIISNQYSPLQHSSQNTTKQLFRYPLPQVLESQPTVEFALPRSGEFQSPLYSSKQLKKVLQLFESAKEDSSKKLEEQIQMRLKHDLSQSQMSEEDKINSDYQQISLNRQDKSQFFAKTFSHSLFSEMQKKILEKYELFKQQIKIKTQIGSHQTYQPLRRQLQQYEGRMRRQLRALQKCKQDYEKSINQLKHKMIQLHINSTLVDKMKIKCNQKLRKVDKIRKCYSAQSFIINSILEDINAKHIDIQSKEKQSFNIFTLNIHKIKNDNKNDDQHVPICPTSPPSGIQLHRITRNNHLDIENNNKQKPTIVQLPIIAINQKDKQKPQQQSFNEDDTSIINHDRSPLVIDEDSDDDGLNLVDDEGLDASQINSQLLIVLNKREVVNGNEHSEEEVGMEALVAESQDGISMLKQCCEQLQEIIQNNLIDQIAEQIFVNQHIYSSFKSYIEKPFVFKPISDYDIQYFLNHQLPKYQPKPSQIHKKINQKINPTSSQILKLIRDFDFQIDQYQLILPQDIFKVYRSHIELSYSTKTIPPNANQLNRQKQKQKGQGDKLQSYSRQNRLAKVITERQLDKKTKRAKFYSFQRDLKIMYMKSVFNSLNEVIIQTKSFHTYMNARSSIGPGELTLAIKEYNLECNEVEALKILKKSKAKVVDIIRCKCMLPVFKNVKELELFQKQINSQINTQFNESEYKWVNYMDEVLQLWQQLSLELIEALILEVCMEVLLMS